jgi:hypothetical protein
MSSHYFTNTLFIMAFGVLSLAVWQHSRTSEEQAAEVAPVEDPMPTMDLSEFTIKLESPEISEENRFGLTPEELRQVRIAAEAQNLSVNEYVRNRLIKNNQAAPSLRGSEFGPMGFNRIEVERVEENC